MPRGGGLLITIHPDVAPVKAAIFFFELCEETVQIEIITYAYFLEAITFLSSEAEIVSYYFCFLRGKKTVYLRVSRCFIWGFLKPYF